MNLLINILLINYDLHLLEIWELHQVIALEIIYYNIHQQQGTRGLCTKNKLIRMCTILVEKNNTIKNR